MYNTEVTVSVSGPTVEAIQRGLDASRAQQLAADTAQGVEANHVAAHATARDWIDAFFTATVATFGEDNVSYHSLNCAVIVNGYGTFTPQKMDIQVMPTVAPGPTTDADGNEIWP